MSHTLTVTCDLCETTKAEIKDGPDEIPVGWVDVHMEQYKAVDVEPAEPELDVDAACDHARELLADTPEGVNVGEHYRRQPTATKKIESVLTFFSEHLFEYHALPRAGEDIVRWMLTTLADFTDDDKSRIREAIETRRASTKRPEHGYGIIGGCFGDGLNQTDIRLATITLCPSCITERGAEVFSKLMALANQDDGDIQLPDSDVLAPREARRRRAMRRRFVR